jgi:hypothetical protein
MVDSNRNSVARFAGLVIEFVDLPGVAQGFRLAPPQALI